MTDKYRKYAFPEGQTVHAKDAPKVELVVRRYLQDIYYYRLKSDPSAKERVHFERELEVHNV